MTGYSKSRARVKIRQSHGENDMAMIEHPVPYEYEGKQYEGRIVYDDSVSENARQYICSQTG